MKPGYACFVASVLLTASLVVLGACSQAPGSPTPSPAASLPPAAATLELTASGMAFDLAELRVPAGQAFAMRLRNDDRDMHNFELRDEAGTSLFRGELFSGPGERHEILPALAAGRYQFLCTAHPYMKGTLSAD